MRPGNRGRGPAAHAALGRLDQTVRENRPWPASGVAVSRSAPPPRACAGRSSSEDEAALRDALHLTGPGADPGPAGRRLLAWRALGAGSVRQWRSAIAVAAAALGLPGDEALQQVIDAAEARAAAARTSSSPAAPWNRPTATAGQGNCSLVGWRTPGSPSG